MCHSDPETVWLHTNSIITISWLLHSGLRTAREQLLERKCLKSKLYKNFIKISAYLPCLLSCSCSAAAGCCFKHSQLQEALEPELRIYAAKDDIKIFILRLTSFTHFSHILHSSVAVFMNLRSLSLWSCLYSKVLTFIHHYIFPLKDKLVI